MSKKPPVVATSATPDEPNRPRWTTYSVAHGCQTVYVAGTFSNAWPKPTAWGIEGAKLIPLAVRAELRPVEPPRLRHRIADALDWLARFLRDDHLTIEPPAIQPESGFKPTAFYSRDGDMLDVYTSSECCYAKWLNHHLTIKIGDETGKIVGVSIHGLSRLLVNPESLGGGT